MHLAGIVTHEELAPLLAGMPEGLSWSICGYPDKYQFIKGKAFGHARLGAYVYLARQGDLAVRLDSGNYRWRFIGTSPPKLIGDSNS